MSDFILSFWERIRVLFYPILGNKIPQYGLKSRINRVHFTLEGNVKKVAGPIFYRGEHVFDPVLLLKREAQFLKMLEKEIFFPSLIESGPDYIVMSDCGMPLSKKTVPKDSLIQVKEIAKTLGKYGIIHRDIKLDNLLVKDGRIHLIDFGWAITSEETGLLCSRDLIPDLDKRMVYDNLFALEQILKSIL